MFSTSALTSVIVRNVELMDQGYGLQNDDASMISCLFLFQGCFVQKGDLRRRGQLRTFLEMGMGV